MIANESSIPWRNLLLLLFLAHLLCFPALAKAAGEVLILLSHDAPPYLQTQIGFQELLSSHDPKLRFEAQSVENDVQLEAMLRRMQTDPPRLILTLGTRATRAVLAREHGIPVISGLIVNQEPLQKAENATAVTLEFSAVEQWRWLRRVLPGARNIGVLFSPSEGEPLFQELERMAHADQIELLPLPAANPADLPALLERLPLRLDALWPVDGARLFAPASVRELLLHSFRNRLPLIGMSASWVQAGALYALEWDYADLGRQCAELAQDILRQGKAAHSLPIQSPRLAHLTVNLNTAAHMKLEWPLELLQEAQEVSP
jgi:putative ABC transport system substrate-binding protein